MVCTAPIDGEQHRRSLPFKLAVFSVSLRNMELTNDEIDTHHRAFFSFNPALFLADLSNIAMDVCADGFDDLERSIYAAEKLDQQSKAAIAKVICETYALTLEHVNRAAANFERYEQLTSLAVPAELFVEQPMPVLPEPVDPQQEQQLDKELQELREQLTQVRLKYRQMKQQLQTVDKDISRAADTSAAYQPLAEAASSVSPTMLEEAAAIGQLAAKLQPMLSRAKQLQAEQQEPISQALAGAAAAGADREETEADVERRVRQMMAEAGATAEQLQAANAALEGV